MSSLEQVRPAYTDSCVSHNRRPKCTTLLPLELHFLPAVSLKLKLISLVESGSRSESESERGRYGLASNSCRILLSTLVDYLSVCFLRALPFLMY